jgi:hypothetical protein
MAGWSIICKLTNFSTDDYPSSFRISMSDECIRRRVVEFLTPVKVTVKLLYRQFDK